MCAGEVVVQKSPANGGTDGDSEGDGEKLTVHADVVVGADGASSRTRSLLQQQVCSCFFR